LHDGSYRTSNPGIAHDNHFFRFLPLTCAELGCLSPATIKDLLIFGGFPEPFSLQSEIQSRRWSREYRSRVIRGDLSDLENVQDLGIIESMEIQSNSLNAKLPIKKPALL